MNNNLDNPRYYLENFRFVLNWVLQRYADLLLADEIAFIEQFSQASESAQALLVRMVMRRGNLFRLSTLHYTEIGDPLEALDPLLAQGWVTADPVLSSAQLFGLLTKNEFAAVLPGSLPKAISKAGLLTVAQTLELSPRSFSEWHHDKQEQVVEVAVADLCDRLRLMFFGNLYQDWSEFILADLGIFTYEKVAFSIASRAFQQRSDLDDYRRLHACRERLQPGVDLVALEAEILAVACTTPWLQSRRARLLFGLGQELERVSATANALRVYVLSGYAGARVRQIRLLEKLGQPGAALALAISAQQLPESAEERQHLARIMPRLQRKLGQVVVRPDKPAQAPRIDLNLPRPTDASSVELVARQAFATPEAPVYYVENTLINGLFGLLCWDAVFAPVTGAFFHPFQSGPADLTSIHFAARRSDQFAHCLAALQSTQYQDIIRHNYRTRFGIVSPFVVWAALGEDLLEQSLHCIPAAHLALFFTRILAGIAVNRNGFPDLIQLWPAQQQYRMIEVKGPGDRLQDNQLRLIDFCLTRQIPVAVCYVEWQECA